MTLQYLHQLQFDIFCHDSRSYHFTAFGPSLRTSTIRVLTFGCKIHVHINISIHGSILLLYPQVNVETVLEQVLQGSVSASSIIRSQHDFLSGGMDREQKAKRKLVSSLPWLMIDR